MQFLIVDILVLMVVFVVFFFFRRADRDNRSLEKIKRFSDRIMEDLGAVAEEKSLVLRDIAIETDVHQQASKKAIDRLREAEEALNQKSQDMEDLRARMDAYNQALVELVNMTQKAEENIGRLRDESLYIDKVGRRIRAAAGQLSQIEERIPKLVAEIHGNNQAVLAEVQSRMTDDFNEKLAVLNDNLEETRAYSSGLMQAVRQEVEHARADLAAKADSYRSAFDAIEADYRARLDTVAAKGETLEAEVFRTLLDRIDLHRQELEKVTITNDEAFRERLNELAAYVEAAGNGIERAVHDFRDRAAVRMDEAEAGIRDHIENRSRDFAGIIEAFKHEMGQWHQDLVDQEGQERQQLELRLQEAKAATERTLVRLADQNDEAEASMERLFKEADEKHVRTAEDFMDRLRARVDGLETSIYQMEDSLKEKLSGVHDQGVQLADNLLDKISQNVDTKTETMRNAIERRVEDINNRVDTAHHQIEASFAGLRERVDTWIEDSRSYITNLDSQVRTLNEESRKANQDHQETIQRHISETQERLGAYEQGLSSRVQNLEEFITRAEQMVHDEFHRLEGLSMELAARNQDTLNKNVDQSAASIRAHQEEVIALLKEHFLGEEVRLKADMANFDTDLGKRFGELRQEAEESLRWARERFGEIGTIQERMGESIGSWKSALAQLEQEHARNLEEVRERLSHETNQGESDVKARLGTLLASMNDTIQRERGFLEIRFAEVKDEGEAMRSQLLQEFQAHVEKVQAHALAMHSRVEQELSTAFGSQQERMQALLVSVEQDIARLQGVSARSTEKFGEWEATIRSTGDALRKDIEELRDHARGLVTQQVEILKVDFDRRNDEVRAHVQETSQKLKSEINHAKGDMEQDLDFVRTQIEQARANYQEQLASMEEQSRALEDQAITGLKARIEDLKEESRQIARKYQEDFTQVMEGMKGNLQSQSEQYQAELKKAQGLGREIQNTFQKIQDEVDLKTQVIRQQLEKEQGTSIASVEALREQNARRIQELAAATDHKFSEALEEIGRKLEGFKAQGETGFQNVAAQVQKWQADYAERIKQLVTESSTLRKDAMAGIQDRVDAMRDEARKISGAVLQDVSRLVNEHQTGIEQQLRQTEEEAKRIEDLHASSRLRFQEIQDILGKAEATALKEFEAMRAQFKQGSDQVRAEFQADFARHKEALAKELAQNVGALAADTSRTRQELAKEMETARAAWAQDLERVGESFARERESWITELRQSLESSRSEGRDLATATEERQAQLAELSRGLEKSLGSLQADLVSKARDLEVLIDTSTKSMAQTMQKTTVEREQAAFVEIERRLHDYESEITYRMSKLEKVNDDIDGLESALRQSMDRLGLKLRDDVKLLGEDIQAQRGQDLEVARRDMEAVRLQMLSMEKEIDELKKRAYDNVNAKLKVFEDEFFVDLTDRSTRMQAKLEEWREQVNATLRNMEQQSARERETLELQYSELLKARLGEFQEKFFTGFQRLETQFGSFNQGLSERMESAENNLNSFRDSLAKDVKQLQGGAQEFVNQQFARVREDLENRLRGFDAELSQRLNSTDTEIRSKVSDLSSMMETMRGDVSVWQAQMLQQIRASEGEVGADIATWRTRTNQVLEEIRLDFTRQKDELVEAGTEERAQIRRDLDDVQTRLGRMSADIELRGREAIDAFVKHYQSFHTDMSRQNKELSDEVDERMSAFRASVVDTRTEFDSLQKRLFGKIEDDAKVLDMNLKEIDKRIKAFMTHTKLFERADALKDELEQKIGALRAELETIESQKRDLVNLDPLIEKVRRLTDEVNDKFNRLSSEKKRLDGLDEDFRRLTGLSQMVDAKLNQVTAASDTLTQIQLTLRQVEEAQKSVDGKLERLEKKARLADATSETVDANFQALQDMEVRLRELREIYGELPARVQDTQDKINALVGGKKDVDAAVKGLSGLDRMLKDIEARMAELNKSREWLAKTETRISEISRDAQEQVNLFGALIKKDVAADAGPAPRSNGQSGPRDLVIKLAQKGWKVEEIAKTTKLSRGEVELILEMSSK